MRRRIGTAITCCAFGLAQGLSCCTSLVQAQTASALPRRATGVGSSVDVLPAFSDPTSISLSSSALFPLTVPAYNSYTPAPGGIPTATIYLNFTGDVNQNWGGYVPGTTPAYDIDGDPTTFSQQELDNIHEIWMRAAEEFSPFNVNVTTVKPPALVQGQSMEVIVGGDGTNGTGSYWMGSKAGGIAFIGGFVNSWQPDSAYVFSGNLGNGTPKYVAMAIAHESGHMFGLDHQRVYDSNNNLVAEYNPGTPDQAPIMGVSYKSTRGLWWYGTSGSLNSYQDDLSIISDLSTNYFGWRPSDHSNSIATATPLSFMGGNASASGVIQSTADKAFYSFTMTQADEVLFEVNGAPFGQMLDPSLALYSSDGTLLQLVATPSLKEDLWANLDPGTYDIAVLSAGVNIGDIGQYSLTASIGVPEPSLASLILACPLFSSLRRRNRR